MSCESVPEASLVKPRVSVATTGAVLMVMVLLIAAPTLVSVAALPVAFSAPIEGPRDSGRQGLVGRQAQLAAVVRRGAERAAARVRLGVVVAVVVGGGVEDAGVGGGVGREVWGVGVLGFAVQGLGSLPPPYGV